MSAMLLLAALCPLAAWADTAAQGAVYASEEGPIGKVVRLLSEMKAQVETEAQQDMLAYNKYMCWCTTNRKEKTLAIESAKQQIADHTMFLEEAAGTEAQLKTAIEGLTADIAEDQEALQSATGIREEENEKFKGQEADMKETRGLLKQAVDTLSKVQLVQKPHQTDVKRAATALMQVHDIMKHRLPSYGSVMQQDLFDVLGSLQGIAQDKAPLGSRLLDAARASERGAAAFQQGSLLPWEKTEEQLGAEKKKNGLVGAASGAKSYNARSGSILGILGQMQDDFSRDLAKAMYDEFNALVSFQKLKSAKISEIHIATTTKARKEKALSDLRADVANAKEDKAALEDALAADEAFLSELEKSCKEEDEEYNRRLAVRTEEIRALAETLKILAADEARATFSRSSLGNASLSFVQKAVSDAGRSESQLEAQDRAAERAMQRIAKVAQKHKDWALVSLAVRTRLDSFTEVVEVMDKMLAELQAQQKQEYQQWESCKTNIDGTEDDITVKTQEKKDLDEVHTSLVDKLATLSTDTETLKKEVAEDERSLKDAGEDRKAENQLYQTSVMDQRAAVNILKKALERLKAFYAAEGAFAQTQQEPGAAAPPPPPAGRAYEKSAGASGVLQVIMKIISDAESTEKELDVSENAAQNRYAEIVRDLTASIEANRNAIEEKASQTASTEVEKSETDEAQLSNGEELEGLGRLLKSHHLECDFLLKYFDIRQQARAEEVDAITDAKAILSGADFGKK